MSVSLHLCSCCVSPDAELTLLAFALARGSVAKVLQALACLSEHLETEYRASTLIVSMASVRLRLLYRNGNVTESSFPLSLSLSLTRGQFKTSTQERKCFAAKNEMHLCTMEAKQLLILL